jgi:hypothetical protein
MRLSPSHPGPMNQFMRCLYCGKDLPLLKRLRGGGEFCSEAHRQQYRHEYEQLALTRLLQSPPAEARRQGKGEPTPIQSPAPQSVTVDPPPPAQPSRPQPEPRPQPQPKREGPERSGIAEKTPVEEQAAGSTAAGSNKDGVKAPAPIGGFLTELPGSAPGSTGLQSPGVALVDLLSPVLPPGPDLTIAAEAERLAAAGSIVLLSVQALTYRSAPRGRVAEVREFSNTLPAFPVQLSPELKISLAVRRAPLPVEIPPCSPGVECRLWTAAEADFPNMDPGLGGLARLEFNAEDAAGTASESAGPVEPERRQPPSSLLPPAADRAEPAIQPAVVFDPTLLAEVFGSHPPVLVRPESLEPRLTAPAAATAPAQPERRNEISLPRPAEPLPIDAATAVPGKARPVQVFAAPLLPESPVRIPRPAAMPLRPAIVLVKTQAVAAGQPVQASPKKPSGQALSEEAEPKQAQSKQAKARQAELKRLPSRETQRSDEAPSAPALVAVTPSPQAAGLAAKPHRIIGRGQPQPASVPETPRASFGESRTPEPLSPPWDDIDLRLPVFESRGPFWTRLPGAAKLAIAALVVAATAGIAYLVTADNQPNARARAASPSAAKDVIMSGALGDQSWIADFAPDPNVHRGRKLSVLRASLPLSNYRLEFQARIESKALSWVYRARDGRNFYVSRVEMVNDGPQPQIALARFAVIDNEEQPHTVLPLDLKVRPDTIYKIRFEAVGDTFTTWIGDKKVDQWGDGHLRSGGVGLYSEKGERASLQGSFTVVPLEAKE